MSLIALGYALQNASTCVNYCLGISILEKASTVCELISAAGVELCKFLHSPGKAPCFPCFLIIGALAGGPEIGSNQAGQLGPQTDCETAFQILAVYPTTLGRTVCRVPFFRGHAAKTAICRKCLGIGMNSFWCKKFQKNNKYSECQ